MNVNAALVWAQRNLQAAGIGTARLDALVLLEDNLGIDRAKLLAEPELLIPNDQFASFKLQVAQRCTYLPLAYIRKQTEFYGRTFLIDERVLEPRPESETLIDEAGILISRLEAPINVIDVGTGSGALIITLKLEHPEIVAYATDISDDCLAVARINAKRFACKIDISKGNLMGAIPRDKLNKQTIVVANLPYVPQTWQLNPPAMHEPAIAIFGGKDGLRVYERLFKQLSTLANSPAYVLTESLPPQHQQLKQLADAHGYRLLKSNDFIQVFSYSA